ncbi:MAG: hypothetical protein DRJ03_04005 [Chloroflexi bacterium]|nr:MAG: hypothetical protein DRJ03_04005 [Chloroflexota bacterium]
MESEDGNVGSFTCEHDDYFKINITSSSGNKTYYIEDNIGYVSPSVYTTFLYRYKTSDTNIKAKIVAVFASGNQTILSETSSTTWVKGSATLDTDKGSLTRIRLYANQATGQVYYDFVLVCKGIFTFPNCGYGLEFTPPARYAMLEIPARVGDITQNLGSPSATVTIGCDLDVGDWKRSGDYVDGEVFLDIAHNSYTEPWQWLDTGTEQFKATLDTPVFRREADGNSARRILELTFREYRRSSASNESYVERFGLNL